MLQFILRRLGLVIPTFIGITLLTFAFVHMIPGDPVMIMAGERGISLSVMLNCWLNSVLINRCGSSTSIISGGDAWRFRHLAEKPNPRVGRVRASL